MLQISKKNRLLMLAIISFFPSSMTFAAGVQCTGGVNCDYSGQTIQSSADGEPGILVGAAGSNVTGNRVNIFTTGNNDASGISALEFGQATLTSTGLPSVIETMGTSSPALILKNGGRITLTNYQISADLSRGVYINNPGGPGSDAINFLTLNNSLLQSQNEAFFIEATGGISTDVFLTLNDTMVSSLNNVLLRATSDGSVSTVVFSAARSTLYGDIVGSGLNLVFADFGDHTNWVGSTGSGIIFDLGIGSASTWYMNANSTIANALINEGTIYFMDPVNNVFKVLTTGTYVGVNGAISMSTQLGGNDSPTDLLRVTGGTALNPEDAEGNTAITIRNANGQGALTTGNGIKIVETVGAVTSSATAFHLAAPVVAGPYEYALVRGSVEGLAPSDDWYLRSEGQYGPLIPLRFINFPFYRSEVSLYSTLPSLAVLYTRGIMGTLHQRMGQQNFSQWRDCGSLEFPAGGWFRVINGGGNINNGTIFEEGADFQYHYLALQTGFDFYHQVYPWGGRDYGGVTLIMGDATNSVEHYTNVSAGNDSITSYSLGAYYTYYGDNGWYVDVLALGHKFDMYADSKRIAATSTMGDSISASLEAGYPFRITDRVSMEPQAQVIYQTLGVNNLTDQGATVRFGRTQSFLSRVGVLVGKTWCPNTGFLQAITNSVSGWARLNYWHEAKGKSTTNFSSATGWVPFHSELAGNFVQADFGLSMPVNRGLSFYADAGESLYLQNKGHFYTLDAGFRMNFA